MALKSQLPPPAAAWGVLGVLAPATDGPIMEPSEANKLLENETNTKDRKKTILKCETLNIRQGFSEARISSAMNLDKNKNFKL